MSKNESLTERAASSNPFGANSRGRDEQEVYESLRAPEAGRRAAEQAQVGRRGQGGEAAEVGGHDRGGKGSVCAGREDRQKTGVDQEAGREI